jgi:hypothetical protein
MTEDHSDPDLLDLSDIPETGTGMAPADMAGLVKGVRGLGRWAKRAHSDRKELRQMARWVVASVVSGAFGMVCTIVGASLYLGARMERIEALADRVERLEARQWDTTHTARSE